MSSTLQSGAYICNRIYTDQGVFDRETETIFRSCWLFVCHESEVPNIGDWRSVDAGGSPLLVWRDEGGKVRCFHAVCRHRGTKVVRERAGNGKSLQCFYHLWTYSTKGQLVDVSANCRGADLVGVAKAAGYAGTGFAKADFPLLEVSCEVFRGLVFVNLARQHGTLGEFLGAAAEGLEEILSPDLEVFSFYNTTVKTNWKLFNDNNRELYHVILHYLNRLTAGYAGKDSGSLHWKLLPNGHAVFGDARRAVIDYGRAGYDAKGATEGFAIPNVAPGAQPIYYLFPDLMINVRWNVMRIDRLIPVAPGLTQIEWRGLGMKGDSAAARRARERNHNLVWGPFGRNLPEDLIAVEAQWEGLQGGDVEESVVAREEGLASMDDASLREFYREWSRVTGVSYSEPGWG